MTKAMATATTNLRIGERCLLIEEGKEYDFTDAELQKIPMGYVSVPDTKKEKKIKNKEGE
ncbi:Uncharacterised protein [Candidatus Anstonella stagnisolia]|nr:Uncharacterised protein [Candidatus Anstonella stagnisolia]